MLAVTTLASSYSKGCGFLTRRISGLHHHRIAEPNFPLMRNLSIAPGFLSFHTKKQDLLQVKSNQLNSDDDQLSPEKRLLNTSSLAKKRPRTYNTKSKEIVKGTDSESAKEKKKFKAKGKLKEKLILRIDRILSNRGLGSRSQMNNLVKKKRVAIKDEETGKLTRIKGPSVRVPKDSTILVDGVEVKPLPLILAYYKPKGILSAMKDETMGRKHLGEVLDPQYVKAGLHPVGRLDFDTSGLILFSSNGDLTQRLLHPRHNVEKEYVATVEYEVNEEILKKTLEDGVETSEGIHTATLLEVSQKFEQTSNEFEQEKSQSTDSAGDKNKNQDDEIRYLTNVRLVVSEGKHRMVRRMLANAGHPVVELKRERHGQIVLTGMDIGAFRDLNDEETSWAESLLFKK